MGNESRVIITADSAQAIREFNRLRTQSTSSLKDIAAYSDKVGAALGAIGLGTGIAAIVSMSDEYAKYTAQLRLATVSQNEYNAAYADVKRIATSSQQSLAGTGTLYARIANGTRELGTTQKQVADITETVNLALKVSGATATESASAQLQLSQAFASGTLRGEEFNAVNEAAPRLMKALADGMGLPIGALKGLAGEGKITSKIMAEVLPQALEKLREEGKQVATIGGALTVLKDEFMELTAIKAQANGTVSLLTGSIKLLSDNLNVLFAVTAGLMTLKLAGYFFAGVASVRAYFAANAELAALVVAERAALIGKAQALVTSTTAAAAATTATLAQAEVTLAGIVTQRNQIIAIREGAVAQLTLARSNIAAAETAIAAATAAGAQSYALRIVRLATAELTAADAARALAMAEIAALGIAETRILGQIAVATEAVNVATAANTVNTTAQAAAHAGLNGALGRTAITASIGTRALGLLGGPVGIITTLLTAGAAAWVLWSGRAKDESSKAAAAVVESSTDMIARLKEENAELDRRWELRNKVPAAKAATDKEVDALAKAKKEMEDAVNGVGRFADLSAKRSADMIANRTANYLDLEQAIVANQAKLQRKAEGTRDDQLKAWRAKNGSAKEQMEAELAELRAKFGTIPADIEVRVRAKYDDKSVASALNKEKTAYDNLIASIRTKAAENTVEAKTDQNASESQKMRIKLDEVLGTGKRALSAAHRELAKDAIAELAATEAALKAREQEKDVQDSLLESTTARHASTAALAAEYAMYGKSSDARALEMIAVKAQADQEKYLTDAKIKGRIVTGDQIKALTAEKDARVLVEQATLAQTSALNYAAGLADENKRFTAEAIFDAKDRATALLAIDAKLWQGRIALAGDGTDAQRTLQNEYTTWYQNQLAKPQIEEQKKMWESIDTTAHDTFVSIFDSGKSAFDRLRDTLKNGLLDLLYQMTVKKWILSIGASVGLSGGVASLAQATTGGTSASGTSSLIGAAQSASSIYKAITSGFAGVTASLGSGIVGLGGMLGSSSLAAFGAGAGSTGIVGAGSAAGLYAASGGTGSAGLVTAGAYTGAAVTAAAGIAAGVLSGNLISGQFGSNATVNGGSAVGAIAGAIFGGPLGAAVGGALGGVVGGTLNRLFGMGDKSVSAQGLRGTLSDAGATGVSYSTWSQAGGLFRSDKSGTDTAALSSDIINSLSTGLVNLKTVSGDFAKNLDIDGAAIKSYSKSFDIALTADAAVNQETITKFFTTIGDEMATQLVPNIAQFALVGETASTTLQRLSGDFAATNTLAGLLGKTGVEAFGSMGMASAAARERLVGLAGGVAALGTSTTFFAQNYLTEAQRLAPVTKALDEAMASLGLSSIVTRKQFADTVTALDLTTAAGAQQFAAMMSLQEAFAQVHAATVDASKSEQAVADERQELQSQLDKLTLTSAQLRAKERAGISAVNLAMFDQITVRQDLVDAYKTESDAIASTATRLTTLGDAYKTFRDGLPLGSLSTLSPTEKAAEAQRQYSDMLAKARSGDATAQSGLTGAASAYLTASQAASGTAAQYARDYARVQADMAIMAANVGSQLTAAQAQQIALDKQVAGLITLNDSVNAGAATVAQAIASLGVLGVKQIAGSHAGGLTSVPYDGYTAELHAGERVLTAFEARNYSGQSGGGNEALLAEVRGLREEVKGLREEGRVNRGEERIENVTIVQNTGTVARLMKRADDNGWLVRANDPLPTKEIA